MGLGSVWADRKKHQRQNAPAVRRRVIIGSVIFKLKKIMAQIYAKVGIEWKLFFEWQNGFRNGREWDKNKLVNFGQGRLVPFFSAVRHGIVVGYYIRDVSKVP